MICGQFIPFLTLFLVPNVGVRIHSFLAIPPTLTEVWIVLYLLVKGVRDPTPGAAPVMAAAAAAAGI
jgi:hypothetical protein